MRSLDEILQRYVDRRTEHGAETVQGVFVDAERTRVFVSDGFVGLVVPAGWVPTATTATKNYAKLVDQSIGASTREGGRSTSHAINQFGLTVAQLSGWLRKDTEPCPLCLGQGLCEPDLSFDVQPVFEEEDAADVHYGWVGNVPIDRRVLQESLYAVNARPQDHVRVFSGIDRGPPRIYTDKPYRGVPYQVKGIKVEHPLWTIYIAGLNEEVPAAPRLHLEAPITAFVSSEADNA